MIAIEGTVVGGNVWITYTPSVIYLKDRQGNIIITEAIYAHVTPQDDDWLVQVSLPDNTEMLTLNSNQWVWLVQEHSDQGTYHYSLPSDPASYTYAASRPRRAQEAR